MAVPIDAWSRTALTALHHHSEGQPPYSSAEISGPLLYLTSVGQCGEGRPIVDLILSCTGWCPVGCLPGQRSSPCGSFLRGKDAPFGVTGAVPFGTLKVVRAEGLEPPYLAALGPKPSASTSSATPASTCI